jgi:hypothetical protein
MRHNKRRLSAMCGCKVGRGARADSGRSRGAASRRKGTLGDWPWVRDIQVLWFSQSREHATGLGRTLRPCANRGRSRAGVPSYVGTHVTRIGRATVGLTDVSEPSIGAVPCTATAGLPQFGGIANVLCRLSLRVDGGCASEACAANHEVFAGAWQFDVMTMPANTRTTCA